MSCHLHSCIRYVSYQKNRLFYVEITEAVARIYSVKKVFLEISQNSQESTCTRDSFLIKLQAWPAILFKKESLAQVFSCEFCEISHKTLFYRTAQVATSKIIVFKKIRDSSTNFTFSF